MNRFSTKIGYGLMSIAALLGLNAHAAADTDLTNALASSTAMVTDNKAIILGYFVGLGVVVLVIKFGKKAVLMAINWAVGAFGGRKGRRR